MSYSVIRAGNYLIYIADNWKLVAESWKLILQTHRFYNMLFYFDTDV